MARRRRRWNRFYDDYVSAQEKASLGADATARATGRGDPFQPVRAAGRKLARTPWGLAWCRHIESFHDFSNRLPRGRTYLRNGYVVDLRIGPGRIDARVAGSRVYELAIDIEPCAPAPWRAVVERCRGAISSMVALLEGRFSAEVMEQITSVEDGLLPDLGQVRLDCSCPDWASLCKHLAAVLYGVGVRLDERPELLFALRGVEPEELLDIDVVPSAASTDDELTDDLSELFGVEIDDSPATETSDSALYVRRQELLEFGIAASTITRWLRRGVLKRTDERGWYEQTEQSRAEFERRFGEA